MIYSYFITLTYSLALIIFNICLFILDVKNYCSQYICKDCDVVLPAYDYIVVGAGSAGSIVASRLAEDPKVSVLLIEAGMDSSAILDIPILSPLMQLSRVDWKYSTTEQENACYALDSRSSKWPMGKIVGGTSRLNYMMYVRGHVQDYDLWAEKGSTDWNFEHVLPYFKKAEKHLGIYSNDSFHHSKNGPMVVSDLHFVTPLAETILDAGRELGYSVRDLNGKYQTGFMQTQVNMYNGSRWSSEYGYLTTHKGGNLRILSNALVVKVLLKSKFEAYGVKLIQFGDIIKVKARRAVVLSAGTIGTPKILMQSGIGPKEHLRSLKISVAQDLPVGKNLQDHVTTGLDLVLLNQSLALSLADVASVNSWWKYFYHGIGPWAAPGCEALAVLHSSLVDCSTDLPDLEIMALSGGISSDGGGHLRKAMGLSDKVWREYFAPLIGQQVASLMPVLLHPKSRGEVLLRSKNPQDPPIINPNYLTHPQDTNTLFQGIMLLKKLINSKAMQKFGAQLNTQPLPGCESFAFDSAPYWKCYIHYLTLTAYHPVGTCKMGNVSDASAVVSPTLKVYKTNRLFVVDASIMPTLPSGNINAAVMMIAEKGTDLIKMEWNLRKMKSKKSDFFQKWFKKQDVFQKWSKKRAFFQKWFKKL